MEKRNIELAFGLSVKLLAAVGIAYVAYLGVDSLFPGDSWPPKDERAEEKAIALYKKKLGMGNSPLSPRTPEDTAVYLSRVIDHEVKKGQLASGRDYITRALDQKLDGRVEVLAGRSESRTLIGKMRSGMKKRDDLARLIAHYERRPGKAAGKETTDKFDRELKELSEHFCGTPFDPLACPELAEGIATTYRAKLEAAKGDSRLREVVEEVEKNCLPRR